jgi:hypothetical protein
MRANIGNALDCGENTCPQCQSARFRQPMIEITLEERQDYFQSNTRCGSQKSSCSFPPPGIAMLIGYGRAAALRAIPHVVSLVSVANRCSSPRVKAPEGPKDNSRGRKLPD